MEDMTTLHADRDKLTLSLSPTFYSIPYRFPTRLAEEVVALQDAASLLVATLQSMRGGRVSDEDMEAAVIAAVSKVKSKFATADRNTRRRKTNATENG